MRRYNTLVLLVLCASATAQESTTFVFGDVNVLTMEAAGSIDNRTVIVTDGRIAAIDSPGDAEVPPDAVVVDASGQYLMPGLTEMHGHVPGSDDWQYLEDVLFLYVANGVTTVRGMQGREGHIELRGRIDRHEVLGPRFITSGPALTGNAVDGPDEARQFVLDQVDAGYDFIKLLRGLTREEFDAAAQAAAEAQRTGIEALERALANGDQAAAEAAVDDMWAALYGSFSANRELAAAWNALAPRVGRQ